MTNTAPIGHNNPPSDVEVFGERIKENHADLLARYAQLIQGAELAPETVEDEDMCQELTNHVKAMRECFKSMEALRENEKEPYLKGGRMVDGFFKFYTTKIEGFGKKLTDRINIYQTKKAEAERQRKLAEAMELRRKAEEEQRLALEAEKAKATALADEIMAGAGAYQEQANEAQKQAEAKPVELSRVRTQQGALATVQEVWIGEIIDFDNLDMEALKPYFPRSEIEKAVQNKARTTKKDDLRGAKIYATTKTVIR